ncbi:MAG: VPLPA-CTERM sorting domain-containing protein [Pseudomonadota bacterium]
MKQVFASLALAALALVSAPADAATLGVFTQNYGAGQDQGVQGGTYGNNFVRVEEFAAVPFADTFDFSGLTYDSIDSITLTLDFDRAGPRIRNNGVVREAWDLNVQGSQIGPTFDNFVGLLDDSQAPMDFVLSAASDVGSIDAFATALANQRITFWFTEPGFISIDNFRLFSATLTVSGTPAVVPLPAPVFLLLTALGGLGLMRRRQKKAALAA